MFDLEERGYVLIASKPSLWLAAKGKTAPDGRSFWELTINNRIEIESRQSR